MLAIIHVFMYCIATNTTLCLYLLCDASGGVPGGWAASASIRRQLVLYGILSYDVPRLILYHTRSFCCHVS
jgi:hypothetical protein